MLCITHLILVANKQIQIAKKSCKKGVIKNLELYLVQIGTFLSRSHKK
jgi:hypothetical protein